MYFNFRKKLNCIYLVGATLIVLKKKLKNQSVLNGRETSLKKKKHYDLGFLGFTWRAFFWVGFLGWVFMPTCYLLNQQHLTHLCHPPQYNYLSFTYTHVLICRFILSPREVSTSQQPVIGFFGTYLVFE